MIGDHHAGREGVMVDATWVAQGLSGAQDAACGMALVSCSYSRGR